jgi:hypothetical protein
LVEGELSDTRQMQRAYWEGVEKLISTRGGPLNPVTALPQSWIAHGIGKTGVGLNMSMHQVRKWVRVEIYLSGRAAKARFAELVTHQQEIEQAFGGALDWQELPEKQDCRVCIARPRSDPWDEIDWPAQHEWLVETAVKLHASIRPFIARLGSYSADTSGASLP